jgi:tetratricopeptide (TPR) repeat protein
VKFNKEILFTLFPIGYWIVISVGALFHFIPEVSQLGAILINLGAFLVAFNGAIIIHEAGHLIAAKAVGGTPRRMVLGKGHELYRMKVFNLRVVINSVFRGGHAYASFEQPGFLKLRYGAFTLGGVLLNVICACFMYTFFEMGFTNPMGEVVIAVPFAIFLANAVMIFNFIPYYTTIAGMRVPTDGLALLKLPFTKLGEIEKRIDENLFWEGHEFLENKDYQSAWIVFNQYLEKYPEAKIISINLALILLKTGRIEESLKESLKLLDHLDDKEVKPYTSLIHNQIAWTYLVLNKINEADHFSALAIKALPNQDYIRGTRGAVLVEKGLLNEGMSLLFQNMDFQFVNSATLMSATYLLLAYRLKENVKESNIYYQFIKRNENRLEVDERILYERSLEKIELQPIVS